MNLGLTPLSQITSGKFILYCRYFSYGFISVLCYRNQQLNVEEKQEV